MQDVGPVAACIRKRGLHLALRVRWTCGTRMSLLVRLLAFFWGTNKLCSFVGWIELVRLLALFWVQMSLLFALPTKVRLRRRLPQV